MGLARNEQLFLGCCVQSNNVPSVFLEGKKKVLTFVLFLSFFPIGIVFTFTARRIAHTHQSLSFETTFNTMNAFSSNDSKPPSSGCSTPRHVTREEEKGGRFHFIPERMKKKSSRIDAAEAIKRLPPSKYTGWRSDRQKAEDARAKAKAEATRLKQKMEEDEKKKQKKCPELTQTRRCT